MTTEIETYLNSLPEDILTINISCKSFKSLPDLTRYKNLKTLYCYNNQLTSLPTLPQSLEVLQCYNNKLTSLPTLPPNLKVLHCFHNQLTSLPTLPQILEILECSNNPIYEIVNNNNLIKIKQNIQILNNFRYLYYCYQFKKQLKKWLYEKVREPNAKKMYNPIYLIENLKEDDDLDTVLDNWK